MKKIMTLNIAFIGTFLLQSCTVSYYQIRNEISSNPPTEHRDSCNVNFSLDVIAQPRQITRIPDYSEERLRKDREAYILASKEIFKKKGCLANYVENEENSNFKISIFKQPFISALPQEWLTGLSLGLIPSWGTRPEEFVYTFESTQNEKRHEYFVDNISFNHLVLFPFFWINLFSLNEEKVYQNALKNFIEN